MKTDNQSHEQAIDLGSMHEVRVAGSEASISPPLFGVSRWKANRQNFWGTPSHPTAVIAREENLSQGKGFGAIFKLSIDDAGQLEVVDALGSVDNGMYLGHDLNVTDVQWEPLKRLSFNFAFSFTFSGETYTFSEGRFEFLFD